MNKVWGYGWVLLVRSPNNLVTKYICHLRLRSQVGLNNPYIMFIAADLSYQCDTGTGSIMLAWHRKCMRLAPTGLRYTVLLWSIYTIVAMEEKNLKCGLGGIRPHALTL